MIDLRIEIPSFKRLSAKAEKARETLAEQHDEIAFSILEILRDRTRADDAVVSGIFHDGWQVRIDHAVPESASFDVIIENVAPYGQSVEYGRRANTGRAPTTKAALRRIAYWAAERGIISMDETELQKLEASHEKRKYKETGSKKARIANLRVGRIRASVKHKDSGSIAFKRDATSTFSGDGHKNPKKVLWALAMSIYSKGTSGKDIVFKSKAQIKERITRAVKRALADV